MMPGMIIGHGIDIVCVPRIKLSIKKYGDRFLKKIFTDAEIGYCKKKAAAPLHFSARFAAKEACLKALGTGFSSGIGFLDIEIKTNSRGQPFLKLNREALKKSKKLKVKKTFVSLSHEESYAIASVILTGY